MEWVHDLVSESIGMRHLISMAVEGGSLVRRKIIVAFGDMEPKLGEDAAVGALS
jgi:hypothetical protein